MHLNRLDIRRITYGEREGQLEGEVTFANPKGEIKLILTQEHIAGVLSVCADAIVLSTQECAKVMCAEIIPQLQLSSKGGVQ